ncbi:MAG: ABC transporter permease [Janthinobacterium lividum]
MRFLLRRLGTALVTVFGVVSVIFVLARLVGDPVALMMQPGMTAADVQALRHALGVDRPVLVQYAHFLLGALRGDFGISPWQGRPAFSLVVGRLPATLQLTLTALAFSTTIALWLGAAAAARPGSPVDRMCHLVAMAGQAMPNFWLALLLVMVFSTGLHWLPPAGYGTLADLVLPTISLGLFSLARMTRLVQSELTGALGQDYVRTARAKGVSERQVLLRHALANIMLPLVTVLAVDFGLLMGGAVVTESVFAWPGIGQLMIQAIGQRDFPVLQASAFVIASIVVAANLLADMTYGLLDPRLHQG